MPCESPIDPPRTFSRSHGEPAASGSTLGSLLSRFREESYQCTRCGQITQKSKSKVSGYDSESSLRHIHCASCGKIVAWPSRGSKLNSVFEGAFLAAAGGALAFLLYPHLNIYGLQAGLFASLYGLLKILVL